MNTASFSIKDAFGFGWAMVKEKFWFLLALILISGFFGMMPDVIQRFTDNATVSFVVRVISIIIGLVVDASLIFIMLRLHDGKEVKVVDMFSQYPLTFRYFVANVSYGLMVAAGVLLLIIPGIYLSLRYQFYKYYLVDKQMDIVESFKESAKMTDGHKWHLLKFFMATFGMNLPGLIGLAFFPADITQVNTFSIVAILLSFGLFVTLPLSMLATAYVYRKLSTPIVEPEPIEEPQLILEPLDQSASLEEKAS